MPKVNPALFDPLTRIENACRRTSGIMLTAPNPPKDCNLELRSGGKAPRQTAVGMRISPCERLEKGWVKLPGLVLKRTL
jgi:hypothetical protein